MRYRNEQVLQREQIRRDFSEHPDYWREDPPEDEIEEEREEEPTCDHNKY